MKKISLALIGAILPMTLAATADAAPSYVRRDSNGGYNVTYDYRDKEKGGWYVGLRGELNLMSWKNEYFSDYVGYGGGDKYSMQSLLGGSIVGGKKFSYFWRAELELGYTGQFSDQDEGFTFKLSAPYAMANVYYDFTGGLYLGAGLGAALPTVSMDGDAFFAGGRSKSAVSPMGAVMLGYSHKLDDNFILDFRYKLSGFNGAKLTRHFEQDDGTPRYLETKVGMVLDNSLSIALRYEF
jgi:opacity protein-like surface antigen